MNSTLTAPPISAFEFEELKNNIDDLYLLLNGIIVSLMQAGFAALEAGSVQSKNATNIILKNVLDTFVCALFYWLIGYSLAFSKGNMLFGYSNWAGFGIPESEMAHWFFQFIFANTAATIISGAVAERCHFVAYIAYSSIISGIVYPVASHWAWDEHGWLATLRPSYMDFGGSGVVHSLGGISSLVAAVLMGPRLGRIKDGKLVEMPGHSLPLVGIGGLIFFSGFLSFNGGSQGHISHPGDGDAISRSVVSTTLSAAGAGISSLLLTKAGLFGSSTWAFASTVNAIIAGLAASCSGADHFDTWGALVNGFLAAVIYLTLRSVINYFKIDDPLEAIAVHLGGGFCGIVSGPIFIKGGIVYTQSTESFLQLWHNLIGWVAIVTWSFFCSLLLFGTLKLTGYLRVSREHELMGLDESHHHEIAYPEAGWGKRKSVSGDDMVERKNGIFSQNGIYHMKMVELSSPSIVVETPRRQSQT